MSPLAARLSLTLSDLNEVDITTRKLFGWMLLIGLAFGVEAVFGFASANSWAALAGRITFGVLASTMIIRQLIAPFDGCSSWLRNLILATFSTILCLGIIGAMEYFYRPGLINQTAVGLKTALYSPVMVLFSWGILTTCDKIFGATSTIPINAANRSSDNKALDRSRQR